MGEILIRNGTIVHSDKQDKKDILIKDNRISKIGENLTASKVTKIIDAKGLYIMAGFIDMHCHLREPGLTHKEDITSGANAAVAGGFSTVCCMPNTSPSLDNVPLISYVINRAKEVNRAKVLPIGAISKGQQGKELAPLKSMAAAGAVAFSDDGLPVENGGLMKLALEYSKSFDLLLITHAEDKTLAGDGVVNEGYHASVAGLKGIPRTAEDVMTARDIILAENANARLHVAHVSTKGSVQLIRDAKKRGVKVTAETCPHYFSATDSEILGYNTYAKVNPPLREESDVKAIIEGIKDGTIDAIATDHAPHHEDEKNTEFDLAPFGISGLETAFSLSYTNLVAKGHISFEKLSQLLSSNPAKILGLEKPKIVVGAIADLTIVDIKKSYTVDKDKFLSKGKNSLFHGKKLTGQVVNTIVDGDVKYFFR